MSILAHTTYAAPRFEREKREQFTAAQLEIKEAKRIQMEIKCSWTEALHLARAEDK